MLLWPPNPSKSSWKEDTPNEGLLISYQDPETEDLGIVDLHGDYQGFTIIEFDSSCLTDPNSMMFMSPQLVPTKSSTYLRAYVVILEELDAIWHNPVKVTWPVIAKRIIKGLKRIGWREVVEASDELLRKGIYFQWKGTKK